MCGIAGIIDLRGHAETSFPMLRRMAHAIVHRGPDEEGFFRAPGVGLANRRLSIIDIQDGQQPIQNEDRDVTVVYNGELFEHRTVRDQLKAKGHKFRTSCDTEILVHLWEEYRERMFDHLQGQFAFALFDHKRRTLILGRDRVGICPLHFTRRDDMVYFGSEVKSLLATGAFTPEADVKGLDHIFSLFGMPTRRTPFAGVSAVMPGHYLKIRFQEDGSAAEIEDHKYWDLQYPDQGDEYNPTDQEKLVDEFQQVFFDAVDTRLQADVPVVSYLSGGVDSATVLAAATRLKREAIPSFTIQIDSAWYDESTPARRIAQLTGSPQTFVKCDSTRLLDGYHNLILATANPVVDTSCPGLYALAGEVRKQGYKVALTGEGSDESMGGYPWFKVNKLLNIFDRGRFKPSMLTRRAFRSIGARHVPAQEWRAVHDLLGGSTAQADLYGMVSSTRRLYFRDDVLDSFDGHLAFHDLDLDFERMKHWHPHNQSLYVGYKTILPGLLLNHKADRVAMANSVETRYPFLDERVIEFMAALHPRWKQRGIMKDKLVLRLMAQRMLPKEVAFQPKKMFRAPFGDTLFEPDSQLVKQLLCKESLERTGYFDPKKIERALTRCRRSVRLPWNRLFEEMGLISVFATQMWHHVFLGGGLCEAPVYTPSTDADVAATGLKATQPKVITAVR